LIWFLERAARNAVLPLLEPARTRSVWPSLEHTAATPLEAQVVCRARVIYADGSMILFQIEAHDEHEQVACGTHKLRVIEADRLPRRWKTKCENANYDKYQCKTENSFRDTTKDNSTSP
jgi:predicted thioesterase